VKPAPTDTSATFWLSATGLLRFRHKAPGRDDILQGLRVIGFERRVNVAFVVPSDALLIEGIFYGGRNYEAALRDRT
jgi:toxin ParE1/3/4